MKLHPASLPLSNANIMQNCNDCGAPQELDSIFCDQCGEPLAKTLPAEPPQNTERRSPATPGIDRRDMKGPPARPSIRERRFAAMFFVVLGVASLIAACATLYCISLFQHLTHDDGYAVIAIMFYVFPTAFTTYGLVSWTKHHWRKHPELLEEIKGGTGAERLVWRFIFIVVLIALAIALHFVLYHNNP